MPKALVLGGYGLIGAYCCRALVDAGFEVVGVGRSRAAAQGSALPVTWRFLDIAAASPATWRNLLAGIDVVVNCAGALQDGPRDDLDVIHVGAVASLVEALQGSDVRFIQISAAGVSERGGTEFVRSKARGDAVLMGSGLNWVILRPTLVIGPAAFGGSAVLRAAAAFPGVFPRIHPDAPIQTVYVQDVAMAVVAAAQHEIAPQTVADLTEDTPRSFAATITTMRDWLGYPAWRRQIDVPGWVTATIGRVADLLGWLGWRSPLRTTALRSLAAGLTGDAQTWRRAGGQPCRSLPQTLAAMPATVQERWFARMFLLLPLAIGVLSVFWILSGLIALAQPQRSAEMLTARGVSTAFAMIVVVGGGLVDLALGIALVIRRWTARAAIGTFVVGVTYLLGSIVLAPDLWADPIGPMVKVIPTLPLSLIVAALMDDR